MINTLHTVQLVVALNYGCLLLTSFDRPLTHVIGLKGLLRQIATRYDDIFCNENTHMLTHPQGCQKEQLLAALR